MKKLSNDENIKNLKKRKILRAVVMICAVITMLLSFASIFYNINLIFPLIAFIITHTMLKIRDKIEINKKDDLKDVRKMLNNSKKR